MKIETIYKLMQANGQRITTQKKIILSAFIDNDNKLLSVNQIMDILPKSQKINSSTVYRNIQNFLDLGILESMVDEAGVTKYAIQCSDEHHHHLICLDCGKVIPIKCDKKRFSDLSYEFNFKEQYHILEIYGICKECTKKRE